MASPSDLCWVLGFTPHGRWVAPVLRAAVRLEFSAARRIATTHLGDESQAPEVMETAIQHTAEHLADLSPVSVEEARAVLLKYFRTEIRRRQRAARRLSYMGTSREIEDLHPPSNFPLSSVEARVDLAKLLRDTPAEVRAAMFLRYGVRESWSEVGHAMAKSGEAARKSCKRGMDLIRKRLGAEDITPRNTDADGLPQKGPREESSQLRERRSG